MIPRNQLTAAKKKKIYICIYIYVCVCVYVYIYICFFHIFYYLFSFLLIHRKAKPNQILFQTDIEFPSISYDATLSKSASPLGGSAPE